MSERLSIEAFGLDLLETGDLDPVYLALWRANLKTDVVLRFLIAYWCLYHVGAAAWIADGADFWGYMEAAAANEEPAPTGGRWPRGAERRHWRGKQAIDSVVALQGVSLDPAELIRGLLGEPSQSSIPFRTVRDGVLKWRGFGPWIAFKIADMIDRLDIKHVDFTEAEVFMFDTPRQAALMLVRQKLQLPDNAKLKDENWAIVEASAYLINHFNGHMAPPREERPVGLQEVETILCKYKSHLSGHYPLGKDTREIIEGLHEWAPLSETAQQLLTELTQVQEHATTWRSSVAASSEAS